MQPIKKIVVIGPESTGKSTLCQDLALHYQTAWVPEFAREFLDTNNNHYTYDDLLKIAKGQIQAEDDIIGSGKNNRSVVFIDTDMYVMKVWCEFAFGKCHPWIIDQIVQRQYSFYLLCNTDLPWANDPLREYPDLESREQLFNMYKDILVNQRTPWIEISGIEKKRLNLAVEAVDILLQ
jgi:NadR type nicotinamide-nucleotide adenylyltransferase